MKREEIAQSTREFFESMQLVSGDRITPAGFGTFIVGSGLNAKAAIPEPAKRSISQLQKSLDSKQARL